MKFDVEWLRKNGFSYLACDKSGQIWAFKPLPIRGVDECEGCWVLPEDMRPPERNKFLSYAVWKRACAKFWCSHRGLSKPISEYDAGLTWEDDPVEIRSP